MIKKKTLQIHIRKEFLNKESCLAEARRILAEKLLDDMTEEQIAPFKEKVADVKADFLSKFDDDALAAFGIELEK